MVSFRRDETGATLLEALMVMPIVLVAISALVEFGYAMHQWNQSAKAMQLGARLAAVSDPIPADMSALTSDFGTSEGGDPVPATVQTVSCGAGTTACDSTRLNRLVFGSDGQCNPNFGTSTPGMCDLNSRIQPQNVLISYRRAGLGYVGRPFGAVSTITVELRDLTLNLPFLGGLLGITSLTVPPHPVSVTSEDLCTTLTC